PRSIERRLFQWLLIITLVPSLTVLAVASWAGHWATRWVGGSGSWSGVAESGRVLLNRADSLSDPQLRAAADAHRRQLTTSLTQARRLEFVGTRMRALLPLFFLALALAAAAIALWAARRMSRSISRPIRELVEWSRHLAREEPLPPPTRREAREVKELRALRSALRNASAEIAAGRARALETERTKNWGEMARRLAHEMKNPLTPLRLSAHRLNAIATQRPELSEPIAVIEEETRRLEELAALFASLGRPVEGPRAAIDIGDMLQRLLASDVPAAIATSLETTSQNPFVLGDYNALIRVFRNLVRNAVEALQVADGNARLQVLIRDEGEWLAVSVIDNGSGLPAENAERVFEPDFTSKAGGTGLGLAVARQTVRAHGGDITTLARKQGAEFVVRMPRLSPGEVE
ncbi:MAG TPA: HAMP domain-containing sensor histidine kinase, partial [Longimicrobiales bacterium]